MNATPTTRSTVRTLATLAVVLALAGVALAGPPLETASATATTADASPAAGNDAPVDRMLNATDWSSAETGANVSVTLEPTGAAAPGGHSAFDIVVTGPDAGIAAYEFELGVDDTDIGSVVGYELAHEPFLYNATIEDGGGTLDAMVALGDNKHDPGESVPVVTVTLAAGDDVPATTEVSLDAFDVMDNENLFYNVTEATGATLAVNPDVVGDGNAATDTTGDGLLNDIDGDGEFTIFDVQALFVNLQNDAVQDHPALFNFNEDDDPDGVTIFDVQALFNRLQADT